MYSPVSVPRTPANSLGPGSPDCLLSTARATTRVRPKRAKSAVTIARLRSTRSVITPAGKVNTSHGRRCTSTTSEIRIGLRVIADASQG